MKSFFLSFFLLTTFFTSNSQTLLERELSAIADSLVKAVHTQIGTTQQHLAIKDFVYQDGKPSTLGSYLAKEFGHVLANTKSSYTIASRSQMEELEKEVKWGDRGRIEDASKAQFGKVKGITALVRGEMSVVGNHVVIYIFLDLLQELTQHVNVKGKITRTPTILHFEVQENKAATSSQTVLEPVSTSQSEVNAPIVTFNNSNIRIDLKTCMHQGTFLDCEFYITSTSSDNFALRRSDTRILDTDQRPYTAQSLTMNYKTSSIQVNQSLQPGVPVAALVRFANVPAHTNAFSLLELNCVSQTGFDFMARFSNVVIR